jgi:hypothetical protein
MSDSEDNKPKGTPLGDNAGVHVPTKEDDAPKEAPLDFGAYIISLGTSAYVAMGNLEDPMTGEKSVDLPTARQLIEILKMLQTKTKGNLEPDEERLLGGLIYELRMAFVEAASKDS